MNFWERVEFELDKKGINKKTLAQQAEFSMSNISKGKKENNIPNAETALKISKFLNVSVEYLVTGTEPSLKNENYDLKKYREYSSFISQLDSLSENQKELVKSIVAQMGAWNVDSKE